MKKHSLEFVTQYTRESHVLDRLSEAFRRALKENPGLLKRTETVSPETGKITTTFRVTLIHED